MIYNTQFQPNFSGEIPRFTERNHPRSVALASYQDDLAQYKSRNNRLQNLNGSGFNTPMVHQ